MVYSDTDQATLREFGRRLRRARAARGLTQQELAEKAGLDRTYVGTIERGKKNPGLLIVNDLALALDENFADFLPCRAGARKN